MFLKDGGLRIANVTKVDAGSYTCVAANQFGTASGTTNLIVTGGWAGKGEGHRTMIYIELQTLQQKSAMMWTLFPLWTNNKYVEK